MPGAAEQVRDGLGAAFDLALVEGRRGDAGDPHQGFEIGTHARHHGRDPPAEVLDIDREGSWAGHVRDRTPGGRRAAPRPTGPARTLVGCSDARGTARQPASAADGAVKPVDSTGKGRPTPRRRDAEQRNRHPVVGRKTAVRPGATKEERKAAKQAQREADRAQRQRARAGMVTGDDRFLPARDRGPARQFARDYVDARRNLGEYFMILAVVAILTGLSGIPAVTYLSSILIWALVVAVAADSFLLRRRLNRLATQKFGAEKASGVGTYGMLRALQLRRTRMPRPQVTRGQYPS